MIEVQYAANLAAINANTFTEGRLCDALISHTLIDCKFHGDLWRKIYDSMALLPFLLTRLLMWDIALE